MQLKTLLNRVQKHSSFVYETVRLVEHPRLAIEVEVRPRANARAKCSQCGGAAPGYDTLPPRCFAFVALPVVFLYAMRRVACVRCGVKVESVPWATGKHRVTDACCPSRNSPTDSADEAEFDHPGVPGAGDP